MAQIIVRKIEAEVMSRLQRRAKGRHRSMTEEVREILRNASREIAPASGGLGTAIASLVHKDRIGRRSP